MTESTSTERSFFSVGSRIEGNLEIDGEVKIQGHVRGKITSTGVVTIGEQASVQANVHAPIVVVQGNVSGEIHARERLELHRTARVHGVLRSPRLRIDEGAVFEGECRMAQPEPKSDPTRIEDRRPTVQLAAAQAVAPAAKSAAQG